MKKENKKDVLVDLLVRQGVWVKDALEWWGKTKELQDEKHAWLFIASCQASLLAAEYVIEEAINNNGE